MRIYLDHAASAPLKPEATEAMQPWTGQHFGNPSSLHADGRSAKAAIDVARERVSNALGCEFGEVIFTSGGTEAIVLGIVGAALAAGTGHRTRVLFAATEHHAVLETQELLIALGYSVELVPVDRFARIELNVLAEMLASDVLLVATMFVNNELGTWQPVDAVSKLAHHHGALYFCDAVQAFGLPAHGGSWSVRSHNADLVSISAHKLGGPKGVGALYVKAGTSIKPIQRGGGQEREVRGGTENLAGIVGFGAVAELRSDGTKRHAARSAFEAVLDGAELTIPNKIPTHPGICHLRFPGISAETILIRLDRAGVSASSGAACSSGSIEPSHVLAACGFDHAAAREGLRFSFGDSTTTAEAERAAGLLNQIVADVRKVRAG